MRHPTIAYYLKATVLSAVWFVAFAYSPWVGEPFHQNPLDASLPVLLLLMIGTGLTMAVLLRAWFERIVSPGRLLLQAATVTFGGALIFCYLLVWSGAKGDILLAVVRGRVFDLASGLLLLPLVGFASVACKLVLQNALFVLPLSLLTALTMRGLTRAKA